MEVIRTGWEFFQNEILVMAWLNRLIGAILNSFGLDTSEKIGGSIQFFLYDIIKIMVLLYVCIIPVEVRLPKHSESILQVRSLKAIPLAQKLNRKSIRTL